MESHVIDLLKIRVPARATNVKFRDEGEFLMILSGFIPRFVVLNSTAKDIFNLCNGKSTVDGIVCNIVKKYNADEKMIARDVIMGLRDLENANIITLSHK